jgi:nitrogen regulatory protein PII-like uncharacterized protein
LDTCSGVKIREAFTTKGVLHSLIGTHLVILGEIIPMPELSVDMLMQTLETSRVLMVTEKEFLDQSAEWLGRSRLTCARPVTILPSRQINLVNWSGGVGKTTLAMAICKRFVERTGLPAGLLEISMGGCAIHARISEDVPEFFAIATQGVAPTRWNGVSLYPMDGRTAEVMWREEPEKVIHVLSSIRNQHTLFVVDAFPGHPAFPNLSEEAPGRLNLIVTSPRDDALLQAKRLLDEIPGQAHLILNMARSLADRAGAQADVILPFRESWATNVDHRLADPLLDLIYPGWARRTK